ncbi:uncharacterized protein BDZ99DRAFT_515909 [Mytilinidion resinicola]|uniref:Uncharacterized protein n=1 Tax=Mytilinidion resinicola TaxID=574789 RepID=A0A6A6Z232_9PEZI|nr:uncharacterized protein BDZ99DRAFT_515909 [Mytilinidion resinicola]KAF2815161.1 hypothetical protein BDZ99DRAFT_515909 [Mytilinidion resinicola]
MSGTGENRHWRRSSQQPQPQQQQQRGDARSGANTPRDGRAQPLTAVPGNVWGVEGKGKPAVALRGGERTPDGASTPVRAPTAPTAPAAQDNHIPVKEFNAGEVKEFLKKRYQEAVADQPLAHYKVAGDSVAKRSSGAWGSRGNMSHQMPNGQDFFTQLKKQLQALDASKG